MKQLLTNSNHYLLVTTNDDHQAAKLLNEHKYQVESEAPLKIKLTADNSVEEIMELLITNKISVQDIQHEDSNLEDSVLKLMTK